MRTYLSALYCMRRAPRSHSCWNAAERSPRLDICRMPEDESSSSAANVCAVRTSRARDRVRGQYTAEHATSRTSLGIDPPTLQSALDATSLRGSAGQFSWSAHVSHCYVNESSPRAAGDLGLIPGRLPNRNQ